MATAWKPSHAIFPHAIVETFPIAEPTPQPAPSLAHHRSPAAGADAAFIFPAPPSIYGGPIGTAVLFEDDEVRIWENRIPPRRKGYQHSHDHDYWLFTVRGGGRIGDLLYVRQGCGAHGGHGTETAGNPSKSEAVSYICELKATAMDAAVVAAAAAAPQAPVGGGASSAILFENIEMRVWDQRVPKGHVGRVPLCVASPHVWHVDVHGARQGAAPLTELAKLRADEVSHTSGNFGNPKKYGATYHTHVGASGRGEAHNVGDGELRCILFELKAKSADKWPSRL